MTAAGDHAGHPKVILQVTRNHDVEFVGRIVRPHVLLDADPGQRPCAIEITRGFALQNHGGGSVVRVEFSELLRETTKARLVPLGVGDPDRPHDGLISDSTVDTWVDWRSVEYRIENTSPFGEITRRPCRGVLGEHFRSGENGAGANLSHGSDRGNQLLKRGDRFRVATFYGKFLGLNRVLRCLLKPPLLRQVVRKALEKAWFLPVFRIPVRQPPLDASDHAELFGL